MACRAARQHRSMSLVPVSNSSLAPRQANKVLRQCTTMSCTFHLGFSLGEGLDSNSLPGFSINDRSYKAWPGSLSTISSVENACALAIKGSELQSSNFLEDVEFTSTPAQEPMYVTGEVIEATVMLNQAVTFDGPPPVLLLQIGDNQREITYVASASTGTSWVFRYTVVADDRDDDGMSFNRFALRGYADADLSNNRVINDPEHRVNAVSEIVSRRVASSPIAPPWYGPGEKIQFTLGFSLPVTVVGDPQLEFNVTVPDGSEFMSYESGSGTKELVFSYTVGTGDDDFDGIWWNADSIRLDSDDSITGVVNGLAADLDHTALLEVGDWGGSPGGGQFMLKPERLAPEPTAALVELFKISREDVFGACGVNPSLFSVAPGVAMREAYREFLFSTVAPLARTVASELSAKLDTNITLDFAELQAADIAGRARAFSSMVSSAAWHWTARRDCRGCWQRNRYGLLEVQEPGSERYRILPDMRA